MMEDSYGNNSQDNSYNEDTKDDQPRQDIFWEAIGRKNDGSEQPFTEPQKHSLQEVEQR